MSDLVAADHFDPATRSCGRQCAHGVFRGAGKGQLIELQQLTARGIEARGRFAFAGPVTGQALFVAALVVAGEGADALEQLGYQNIALADRAQTALQLCRQNSYDLVICDYNLSKGKDGYQLFDELKTRGLHKPACGVIFISAETDPALVHSVLELQPDEFMAKPFIIRDLQQRIERVLKRKQLLRPFYDLL